MSSTLRPLGALTAVLALLVASCASPPSAAQRLASTDAACHRAAEPLQGVDPPADYPALAAAALTLTGIGVAQAEAVRDLATVRGDDVAAGSVAGSLYDLADAARRLHVAAGAADPAAVAQTARATAVAAEDASSDAGAAHLAACGTGLASPVQALFVGAQSMVRHDFTQAAAARCATATEAITGAGDPQTRAGAVRFVGSGLEHLVALVDDLDALPVAPGDEAAVADVLGAQRVVNDRVSQYAGAVEAGDTERREELDGELAALIRVVHPKWEALGLVPCGAGLGV